PVGLRAAAVARAVAAARRRAHASAAALLPHAADLPGALVSLRRAGAGRRLAADRGAAARTLPRRARELGARALRGDPRRDRADRPLRAGRSRPPVDLRGRAAAWARGTWPGPPSRARAGLAAHRV